MLLQPNTTFDNHYTLIRQLGRGGFSEVWLAHDSYMDLDVAIKIYAPGQGMDASSINEFRREITGVFHLNHPNLLRPQHLGIYENMPYLIMMYCAAGSCTNRIGKMSEQELWKLIHDVAAGLACLHEHDVVHQDIKPDNILQDDAGNYLITDFGISTRARSTLRKSVMSSTNSAGTLAYMGPERFSTQPAPTKASDIWSLGAMLYELLEGVTPFPPDFGGSMLNAGAAIPTINAPVSENLKQTIYKMLSKETWDRPTAATLVQWASNPSAVTNDTPKSQPTATKNTPQYTQTSQPKSKRWIWIVVGLIILAGLGVLGVHEVQRRQIAIAEQEQRYQDSIRHIQIQDSICEVRRQDSIRTEQDKARRRDSIAAAQLAERERQRREAEEAERRRIENEKKRIAEERKRAGLGSHNGHDYVDLGLSVKWATCNVGAISSEGYGNYYAWGETHTKTSYSWSTYKWYNGSIYSKEGDYVMKYDKQKKYVTNSDHGIVDNKKRLDLSDDAANTNWGGTWRIPTMDEWTELKESCIWTWTNQNGILGYKVTRDGKSIFLPVAGARGECSEKQYGYYWSSNGSDISAQYFMITADDFYVWFRYRFMGHTIRPVCK